MFIFMCMGILPAGVSAQDVHAMPVGAEEGTGAPRNGVTNECELNCRC